MAAADILEALLRANGAATLAILLALCLRRPVRTAFGAGAAYALWLMVPAAVSASLAPAPSGLAAESGLAAQALRFTVLAPSLPAPRADLVSLALAAWLLGAAAGLALLSVRQIRLTRALGLLREEPGAVRTARAEHRGVGPAVVGLLRPRIVLPTDFHVRYTSREQAMILAHERAHLDGNDTRINALIALARCLAWFNPVVHVGAAYARLDQELARDAVVAERFPDDRRTYAEAMLKAQLAAVDAGCGWAPRSSTTLKRRVAMLARPARGPARRIAGAAGAAAASALVGFAAWAAQPPQPTAQLAQLDGQPSAQPGQPQAQQGTQAGQPARQPLVRVAPAYPAEAGAQGLEADCTVTFDLDDAGDTTGVSAVCTDPAFTEAAEAAVERWRYAARADDTSGESRASVEVTMEFRTSAE